VHVFPATDSEFSAMLWEFNAMLWEFSAMLWERALPANRRETASVSFWFQSIRLAGNARSYNREQSLLLQSRICSKFIEIL
jgi:hypothetical protein